MRRGGRLVWADALKVDGEIIEKLDAPVGFGGARAYATALYIGPDAPEHLERYMRELAVFQQRWGAAEVVDPWHHPRLNRQSEVFS